MKSKTRNKKTHIPLQKVPTGIEGIDQVLFGGIAKGRSTVILGGTGSGKSILGLEYVYRGALAGESGIYISFEESAESTCTNAMTLGWNFSKLGKNKLEIVDSRFNSGEIVSGDFDLGGLLSYIEVRVKANDVRRIFVDAIDVYTSMYGSAQRELQELRTLFDWFQKKKITVMWGLKEVESEGSICRFVEFMSDSIIRLSYNLFDQKNVRHLVVRKYRGSDYGRREYPFLITKDGIKVLAVTRQKPGPAIRTRVFSTGNDRIDAMLGGGYKSGSCILIAGQTGTGKTILANTISNATAHCGEKILYINYEESEDDLIECMLSVGIDLRPQIKKNMLCFIEDVPDSYGYEEHLLCILDNISTHKPKHVVLDSITACGRIGTESDNIEFISRLITFCRDAGITLIATNTVQSSDSTNNIEEISGISISSVVDTIILMNYITVGSEVNRTMTVLKSRGMNHSNQCREYNITSNGMVVADAYSGMGGALTGTARQEAEAKDEILKRKKENEIKIKSQERIMKQIALDVERERLKVKELLSEKEVEIETVRRKQEIKKEQIAVKAEVARLEAEIVAIDAFLDTLKQEEGIRVSSGKERGSMRGATPPGIVKSRKSRNSNRVRSRNRKSN